MGDPMGERMEAALISGYVGDSVYPKNETELDRNLEISGLGDRGAFRVDGSVLGRDIHVRGPGVVSGSLFSRGDVHLDNHSAGRQSFRSGLFARGDVRTRIRDLPLMESLAADVNNADYVIRGDLVARNAQLENVVVVGNIDAENVELRHCVVFGSIVARGDLLAIASTILAYSAGSITFSGPCCLVFPSGESVVKPAFSSYADGDGVVRDATVCFYPLIREHGAVTNRSWKADGASEADAVLDVDADWVKVAVQPAGQMDAAPEERWVMSLAGRLLDYEVMRPRVQALTSVLRSGLAFDHYDPDRRAEVVATWRQLCTPEELAVLKIATGFVGDG